jgi:hypothetical protein
MPQSVGPSRSGRVGTERRFPGPPIFGPQREAAALRPVQEFDERYRRAGELDQISI